MSTASLRTQVIDGEVCFNEDAFLDCAEIYSARAALHTKVYNHRCAESAGKEGFVVGLEEASGAPGAT